MRWERDPTPVPGAASAPISASTGPSSYSEPPSSDYTGAHWVTCTHSTHPPRAHGSLSREIDTPSRQGPAVQGKATSYPPLTPLFYPLHRTATRNPARAQQQVSTAARPPPRSHSLLGTESRSVPCCSTSSRVPEACAAHSAAGQQKQKERQLLGSGRL